jgi:hypothetical protein
MRYGFVVIAILPLTSRKQISLEGKYHSMDLAAVAAVNCLNQSYYYASLLLQHSETASPPQTALTYWPL